MKYYIAITPLDKLHQDFVPSYEGFVEYAKVTALFVAIAGVMATVVKSARK